jgi:hypothetical protein
VLSDRSKEVLVNAEYVAVSRVQEANDSYWP